MLYSRLSGSSTGVLLREIPNECSVKFTAFFRKDRTGLIAFILEVFFFFCFLFYVCLVLVPFSQPICAQTGIQSCHKPLNRQQGSVCRVGGPSARVGQRPCVTQRLPGAPIGCWNPRPFCKTLPVATRGRRRNFSSPVGNLGKLSPYLFLIKKMNDSNVNWMIKAAFSYF